MNWQGKGHSRERKLVEPRPACRRAQTLCEQSSLVLGTKCCVPPHIELLTPVFKVRKKVIRLSEVLKVGPSSNRISVFIKRVQRAHFLFMMESAMWCHSKKTALYKPERALTRTQACWDFDLELLATRTEEISFCSSSHIVWHFVMATQAN